MKRLPVFQSFHLYATALLLLISVVFFFFTFQPSEVAIVTLEPTKEIGLSGTFLKGLSCVLFSQDQMKYFTTLMQNYCFHYLIE